MGTGVKARAGFALDRGLYGAGPPITYPQDPPGAAQIGAGHQVPLSAESMTEAHEFALDDSLVGAGVQLPGEIAEVAVPGNVEGPLRWRGWERLLYCAMGFEHPDNSPADIIPVGTAGYGHLFEQDDVLADSPWLAGERTPGWPAGDHKVRRGVFGADKGRGAAANHAFSSCMVDKMTITGNPREVRVAFDLIGYKRNIGAYNSASWTLPTGAESMALFQQLTVMLGTRAGGFAGLTAFCPSTFELTTSNNLKGDDRSVCTAPYIVQPERNAHRETTLKLEFPRYNTDAETLLGYAQLGTEMAGYLEFHGPALGVGNRRYGFYMSSLVATEDAPGNIDGPGVLTYSITFRAHKPKGSDIFVGSGKHFGIALVKDGEMVASAVNEDTTPYSTEV